MEENLHEIDILIAEYPYYPLLYFQRAKLLAKDKNEAYKNALKLASIYAPNRRKLQEFIENPTDYRKQIIIHPEWLSENSDVQKDYTANVNDEELIKEILTLEEPQEYVPSVQETPIVEEVSEIQKILSHFTEETPVQNNTIIQEIEQLKLTIQQNQEKARLALFQNAPKEKTAVHTADVTTLIPEDTNLVQKADTAIHIHETASFTQEVLDISQTEEEKQNTTEKTEEITEITLNTVVSDMQEEQIKQVPETKTQQEPVSLNVPKIKEWFEQELKVVQSEKEEKENQTAQIEQTNAKKEQESTTAEFSETKIVEVSAEGYLSWLDELLGMQKNAQKTTETKNTLDKKALQNSIIDKFLEKQPKITKPNLTETPIIEDKTESQSVEYEDIASETLAKILVMQKQYDRAIRIYQVLITKNPTHKEQYQKIIQDIQSKMN